MSIFSKSGLVPQVGSAFRAAIQPKTYPALRSPWTFYGDRAPLWARCAWLGEPYTNPAQGNTVPGNITFSTYGGEIAAVGGKGSAKTWTATMADIEWVQRYPGGRMFIAANTYQQAFASGGDALVEICKAIGLKYIFREKMTLDGQRLVNVYYFPDFDSAICILSFERIEMIEGSRWGRGHIEEIQDCKRKDVETARSRVRHRTGDRSMVYCGMPDETTHWMYGFFADIGCPLYEPPLRENLHNVPGYLQWLQQQYRDPALLEKYVNGARVALHRSRCLPLLDASVHIKGPLAHHTVRDPYRRLYVAFDFNVAPMCVSLWQIKEHDFTLASGEAVRKSIYAQVGEYELWGATTGQVCEVILEDIKGHAGGVTVLGDATGNRRDTRSPGETDWTLIRKAFEGLPGAEIIPGVIRKRSKKKGIGRSKGGEPRITYLNPPVRDRINTFNAALVDSDGHPRVAFLPESIYESGGCARSCGEVKYRPDGSVDQTNDALEGRGLARTHFFDGAGYFIYLMEGHKKGEPGLAPVSKPGMQAEPAGEARARRLSGADAGAALMPSATVPVRPQRGTWGERPASWG